MNASELRIGNKLMRPNGNIAIVTWGVIKDIEYGDSTYSPITLTEEWLLKLGFEFSDYEIDEEFTMMEYKLILKGKTYSYLLTHVDIENYQFCIKTTFAGDIALSMIKYIHQLQNLYFALTGQELEIE